MTIHREPLRSAVRRAVFERVVAHELEPGSPINEGELAEELGVSRTPLREALIGLEAEGLVESSPGRGFSVAPLREETARDLYELVGVLERLALGWCEGPSEEDLARLEELDAERLAAGLSPAESLEIDTGWHERLLETCRNRELLASLAREKNRLYRFEFVYMSDRARVKDALADHGRILEALARGDREGAGELLERHWRSGAERFPGTA